jgi:hypothetical protein
MLECVDETDICNENSLGEAAYRPFYHALKEGEFSRMYLLLDELRRYPILGASSPSAAVESVEPA